MTGLPHTDLTLPNPHGYIFIVNSAFAYRKGVLWDDFCEGKSKIKKNAKRSVEEGDKFCYEGYSERPCQTAQF